MSPVEEWSVLPVWGATVSELLLDEHGEDDGVGVGESPAAKKPHCEFNQIDLKSNWVSVTSIPFLSNKQNLITSICMLRNVLSTHSEYNYMLH